MTTAPAIRGPFVAINCGAIPESLMESELFGYEPGAFSGREQRGQKGLLEQAHTGTFFLDEVSEMPVSLQVKLLRVLQERVVRRVGGKVNHSVDIRIIAASNRNLRELVAQGAFREDLFFRLDVIPLFVPPLRERQGDIRLLVAISSSRSAANGAAPTGSPPNSCTLSRPTRGPATCAN